VIQGDYWAVVWKDSRFLMPVLAGVCVDSIGIANTGKLIRSSLLQRRKSTVYHDKIILSIANHDSVVPLSFTGSAFFRFDLMY
jgi:hypothetical protein